MTQVEYEQFVSTTESLNPPTARIVLFGSIPEDEYPQLSKDLENECGGKIHRIRDFSQLEDAIDGKLPRDRKGQKTIAVVVAQSFEQPPRVGALPSVLDIDESRLISSIRSVCEKNNVTLGRYQRNSNGSYEFTEDKDS